MSQLKVNSIVPAAGVPAGADGGGIIQIVQTETSTQSNTTSTSDQTILSQAITPRSSNNKILVIASASFLGSNSEVFFSIYRNATKITGNLKTCGGSTWTASATHVLDSPATTSSVTYYFKYRSQSGNTVYAGTNDGTYQTFLTLMEVSG